MRTVRKVRLMTVAYIALRFSATEIGLATAEQAPSDGNDVTSESVKKTRMVNKAATGINLAFRPRDFKAVKEVCSWLVGWLVCGWLVICLAG